MKKSVILLIFIFMFVSVSAKELTIPELFETEKISIIQDGKEVYYYAGDRLIAVNDEYTYQGHLGSDINSKSLPFGQVLNVDNRFSFTGKELDEDLYYFNARYYNPNLGKFTSIDPVKDNHPYSYVSSNPLTFIDPDGKRLVRFSWTSGSNAYQDEHYPTSHYVTELRFGGGPWANAGQTPELFMDFDIPDPLLATGVQGRVKAVSASTNTESIFSVPSDTYYGPSVSGVDDGGMASPDELEGKVLPTPYPNPTSSLNSIRYYVPQAGAENLKLQVFDIKGRLIRDIPVDPTNPGYNEYQWNLEDAQGQDVASGTYIIRYTFDFNFEAIVKNADGEEITRARMTKLDYRRKMMVIR